MASVEINFDNQNHFFSGQTVTGNVVIELTRSIKIKKLVLTIRGKGGCRWSKSKSNFTSSTTIDFIGNETVFNSIIDLIPDKMVLPAGSHKYKFEFTVPQKCPGSIKRAISKDDDGLSCHLKYEAAVYFVRPWKFDLRFDKELKVISGIDLNFYPKFKIPVILENAISFASIARLGYVAEEEIPVNVQIKNSNNRQLSRIVCSLIKNMSTGPGYLYNSSNTKQSEKVAVFSPGQAEYKFWLNIPGECETTTVDPYDKMINIQYKLLIQFQETKDTLKFQDVATVKFPIIIGAKPIRQVNVS